MSNLYPISAETIAACLAVEIRVEKPSIMKVMSRLRGNHPGVKAFPRVTDSGFMFADLAFPIYVDDASAASAVSQWYADSLIAERCWVTRITADSAVLEALLGTDFGGDAATTRVFDTNSDERDNNGLAIPVAVDLLAVGTTAKDAADAVVDALTRDADDLHGTDGAVAALPFVTAALAVARAEWVRP